MTKSSFGISLDLERRRVTTLSVSPHGPHVGQLQHEWAPTASTAEVRKLFPDSDREIVLGLPTRAVHTRYVELPGNLKPEALETAVRSEVLRYFPFRKASHLVSRAACAPLSGDRKRKGFVLFVSDSQVAKSHVEWLSQLDRKPAHVEFASLGTTRWIQWEKPELRKGTYLWADLQDDHVEVGLVVDRGFYGCRRLEPPVVSTPEWKEGRPLDGCGVYLDYLASQIAGVAAHFCHRICAQRLTPKTLVLCGSHSQDPHLQRAIQACIDVPLTALHTDKLGLDPDFRTAAGLSLRSVEV